MRVLRVYHGGRDAAHRERDRALVRAGVDLTLVVPRSWPEDGAQAVLTAEPFDVVEVDVLRPGAVTRHRLAEPATLRALVERLRPDVVDVHEEPVSTVAHQVLRLLPAAQVAVGYTAQNLDKRFPPPFAQRERAVLGRLQGLYPCSRQAASVAVGKGYAGAVRVLPLAPPAGWGAGDQQPPGDAPALLLVGRLLPEKGGLDAVRVLAAVPGATLTVVGAGPQEHAVRALAAELGVADRVVVRPWAGAAELAADYRRAHVVLVPSRATPGWVEQFGRVVVEAQAAGAVVVGYASGALPEVVGGAGVLVGEGDVAALGAAVRGIGARWAGLRERGLAAAPTWDGVAAGQVELYDAAVGARRGAARVDRVAATAVWGPTAGGRPFALPGLRGDTVAARALGAVVDRPAAAVLERPRVVFLDHTAVLSGGELALLRLVQAVPGVDAHVVLGADGPLRPRLEAAGATVEVLALDRRAARTPRTGLGLGTVRAGWGLARYAVLLGRRLRELDPDVVHTNSLKSGLYGSVAGRLARRPVVWHLRDRLTPDYLPPRSAALLRLALRCLPRVVVSSSVETRRASGVVPGRAVRATLVLHDPYRPTREPVRRSGSPLVVGMVGRLAPWKGQDVLLSALAAPGLEDVRVRIVGSALFGEDAWATGLPVLAAALGVADRVDFAGFADDVEAELADVDVLVHASVVPEPWGQVVVEGMAAGLPVVATAAGGPAEIITDGVDGRLVPPGDVDALAAALRRLVAAPELRAGLGRRAVLRAADYDPAVVGPGWLALFREVGALRRGGRRG